MLTFWPSVGHLRNPYDYKNIHLLTAQDLGTKSETCIKIRILYYLIVQIYLIQYYLCGIWSETTAPFKPHKVASRTRYKTSHHHQLQRTTKPDCRSTHL